MTFVGKHANTTGENRQIQRCAALLSPTWEKLTQNSLQAAQHKGIFVRWPIPSLTLSWDKEQ